MSSSNHENFTPHTENSCTLLLPASPSGTPLVFLNPVQEYNRDLSVAALTTFTRLRQAELQKKLKRSDFIFRPTVLDALSATGLRAIRYTREIGSVDYVVANDMSDEAVECIERNVKHNQVEKKSMLEEKDRVKKVFYSPQERSPYVIPHHSDAILLLHLSHLATSYKAPSTSSTIPTSLLPISKPFDVIDLDPYGTCAPFVDAAVQAIKDDGLLMVTATDMAVAASVGHHEKCFGNYGGVGVRKEWCHELAVRLILHSLATAAARYGRTIQPLLSLSIDFYARVFVRVSTSRQGVKDLASKTGVLYVCDFCTQGGVQPFGRISGGAVKADDSEQVEIEFKGKKGKGKGKQEQKKWHIPAGPPVEKRCDQCGSGFHIAGPCWIGTLHDKEFIQECLSTVKAREEGIDASHVTSVSSSSTLGVDTSQTSTTNHDQADVGGASSTSDPATIVQEKLEPFGTTDRLKGMLQVTLSETEDLFYFTPSRVSGLFHCRTPPLEHIISALLHAKFRVSRSHALAGSLKTNAPPSFIHAMWRRWIVALHPHPVNVSNISSPAARQLLQSITETNSEGASKTVSLKDESTTNETNKKMIQDSENWISPQGQELKIIFTKHSDLDGVLLRDVKLVRYQANPEPGWGPKRKAVEGKGKRKKGGDEVEGEEDDGREGKKVKIDSNL